MNSSSDFNIAWKYQSVAVLLVVFTAIAGCQSDRRGTLEGAIDPIQTQGKVVALSDAQQEDGVWINHLAAGAPRAVGQVSLERSATRGGLHCLLGSIVTRNLMATILTAVCVMPGTSTPSSEIAWVFNGPRC